MREAPGALTDFLHPNSIVAYRASGMRYHPVQTASDAKDPIDVFGLTDPFVENGSYSFEGQVFCVDEPGVYRFFHPSRGGRQLISLPSDLVGVAECCAETVGLGNADRGKPYSVIERTLLHRRVITHCSHISYLSVWMAQKAGHKGVVWLLRNHEAEEVGDILPSHAISELTDATGQDVRLFDLSFGVEMLVEDQPTDFLSYRKALIEGRPTQIQKISGDFGFGHNSRFFEIAAGDFKDDYLLAHLDALRDAHWRLVISDQIQGNDGEDGFFIPRSLLNKTGDALERALTGVSAEQKKQIIPVDDGDIEVPRFSRSKTSLNDNWNGHSLTDGAAIKVAPADTPEEHIDTLTSFPKSKFVLTNKKFLRLDDDMVIELPPDSCVRINRMPIYQPIQIIRIARNPARFISSVLEGFAAGDQNTNFSLRDLSVVARSRKVVATGETRLSFLIDLLTLLRFPYRLWRIPTRLTGRDEWPVESFINMIELSDGKGGVELIDVDRKCRLTVQGKPVGFVGVEATSARDPHAVESEPVCKSTNDAYAERDSATGVSMDFVGPLWYGTDLVWRETLGRVPAIGQQSDGVQITTKLSQAICRRMHGAPEALRPHLKTTLSIRNVL